MKKTLNIEGIQSELRGGSAFFPGYKGVSPTPTPSQETNPEPAKNTLPPDRPTARPSSEPTERPTDRPTGRRILVRRGFEWYEDQLSALKKLSLEEQMEGKDGSMSAMVREALDDYLKKRRSGK